MAQYAHQEGSPAGVFGPSWELFGQVVAGLTTPESLALAHGEVEDQLLAGSRELARRLFQAHLDLRAAQETRRQDVTDAAGVTRTRVEPGHQRALRTVFGTVTATRMAYRAPGAANVHPADAQLNLYGASAAGYRLRRASGRPPPGRSPVGPRAVSYAPAYTIQGGTSETLRTLLAERVLGLPR